VPCSSYPLDGGAASDVTPGGADAGLESDGACADLGYSWVLGPCPLASRGYEPDACRDTEDEAVFVYRTLGCFEEAGGVGGPVDFEVDEVAEYCQWRSSIGFDGPIVDGVRDCGTHVEIAFHVNEPCNACDAEGAVCVSLVLPNTPQPVRFLPEWREPIEEQFGDSYVCRMRTD
jgi:hypothetical protein